MKKHPAIAMLEFSDIPAGMRATDALLKKAPIAWLKCGTITRGRYLALIAGTTASVVESLQEGLVVGGTAILDHVLLPDVHPRLHDAILGQRRPMGVGALAVVETDTASANVRAIEAALKGTPVELIEIRLADSGLSGKGVSVLQGALHDIEAALHLATAVTEGRGGTLRTTTIAAPHEALVHELAGGTTFAPADVIELDGEVE